MRFNCMARSRKKLTDSLDHIRYRMLSVIEDMQEVIDSLNEGSDDQFTKKEVSELINMECSKLCDYFEQQIEAVYTSNRGGIHKRRKS